MEVEERIRDRGREASQNRGRTLSPEAGKGGAQPLQEDLKVAQSQGV